MLASFCIRHEMWRAVCESPVGSSQDTAEILFFNSRERPPARTRFVFVPAACCNFVDEGCLTF